jgi:hypothetical protein
VIAVVAWQVIVVLVVLGDEWALAEVESNTCWNTLDSGLPDIPLYVRTRRGKTFEADGKNCCRAGVLATTLRSPSRMTAKKGSYKIVRSE